MKYLIALTFLFVSFSAHADTIVGITIDHINKRNKPVTVSSSDHPVRLGSKALLFKVGKGDCRGNKYYNDCKNGRARSEIADRKRIRTDTETWYSFSLFVPESTPALGKNTGTILAQFQDTKGSGEITLGFALWPEGLELTQDDPKTRQTDDNDPPRPMVIKTIVPDYAVRERWHDITVQAVWSTKPSGMIKVWLNGRLVHSHKGRNLNRSVAPAFKFGVYQSGLKKLKGTIPTQMVYFDEIKRGASQAAVALIKN